MILIDSYIPMYLVGGPHPHKSDARRLLEAVLSELQRVVTDAEVLQEILPRYTALNRWDTLQLAFDALLGIVDDVLSVDRRALSGDWADLSRRQQGTYKMRHRKTSRVLRNSVTLRSPTVRMLASLFWM